MSAPKPTLGYPSRSAAVVALRAQHWTTARIAAAIGIPETTVAALEHSASRRRAPRPAEQQGRTVLFPIDVLERLAPHATPRRITANQLARDIVETALEEGMIDAILDDQRRPRR